MNLLKQICEAPKMTFQDFAASYKMNRTMALDMARIFGVSMAQAQLWVIRIVKGN